MFDGLVGRTEASPVPLEFGDVIFDARSRRLLVGGRQVHLSPKAFDLLALLIERRPAAVSKPEIAERLWRGTHVSESSLPSLVSEIRAAIDDSRRQHRFIRTLHARGYAFDRPAAKPDDREAAAGWLLGSRDRIALAIGETILGREGPDVILVNAASVSRRHARVVIAATGAVIEDLGSKNGTYVNDRRVGAPTPVVEGDQVRIGSVLFTFRTTPPDGTTETLSPPDGSRSHP